MKLSDWLEPGSAYAAWPFPRHHVRVAWLLALLVVPPTILANVRLDSIVLVLILVPWAGAATGLTVMALLDWSSVRLAEHRRLARTVQAGVRLLVSALGAAGIAAGVLVAWRVLAAAWEHGRFPVQGLFLAALGLGLCVIGAQLAMLPYGRLRRTIQEHGRHGA
jgi:hypothetical protein